MNSPSPDCQFVPLFPSTQERLPYGLPSQPKGFPALPEAWTVDYEKIPLVSGKSKPSKKGADESLYTQRFMGPRKDLAHKALIVFHGQGEHSGRYLHLPHYLQDTFGSIYLIDHRGHGQSSGNRGHIDDFDVYANDAAMAVQRYTRHLEKEFGKKAEAHLLGHSMGGLITLRMLQLHPDLKLASVSISAPMIELAFKVPLIKDLAAKLLVKLIPNVSIAGEPLAHLVSRDPHVVEHYRSDRWNHGLASPSFYMTYLSVKEKLKAKAKVDAFPYPLLFLIPTGDKIIDHQATLNFYDSVKAKEKKIVIYTDAYHEILNEPIKEQAFSDIKDFVRSHSRT